VQESVQMYLENNPELAFGVSEALGHTVPNGASAPEARDGREDAGYVEDREKEHVWTKEARREMQRAALMPLPDDDDSPIDKKMTKERTAKLRGLDRQKVYVAGSP